MEEFAASLGRTARENRRPMMLRGSLSAGRNVECYSDAVRHTLPLGDDPDTLYKSFSKMHQRNIRKAGRAGVRILCSSVADAVNVFYGLHLLTRRRLGVPIQPQRFFRLLGERLLVPGLGFVLTAYLEDVPVASAVFLAWNGWLIYKYGASDARYWECRPNNLLFWEAIRWGLGHGCHTLDFGRTDLDDQGLRDFKMGWGGREEALVYSVIGEPAPKVSAFRLSHLMTPVIQRSPAWVCRLLGELFYKYAA
jgi:lipid II:glycine glycyltransferase (peptidoglycan interpeptide bridge formation enzyme)